MNTPDPDSFLLNGSAEIFDRMIREQGAEAVLSALMSRYSSLSGQAALAERIAGAASLQRRGGSIHTIAVFYYCANNGGAERVLCHLLCLWARQGYRVLLMTDRPATPEDYPLPEGIHRYELPDTFTPTDETRLSRFRQIQKILLEEKADAFVHHAWLSRNLLWDLLAVKTLGIPFLQYTHGVFSCLISEGNPEDMDILRCLTRIYRLADGVVALSKTYQAFWQNFNPHTYLLCNPCLAPSPRTLARKPCRLLWIGRIAPEKRPLEAVKILHNLRRTCPEATLTIVGSAHPAFRSLQDELIRLIAELHEENTVTLAGFQSDPAPYYQEASLLLVTSAYEGFPLAIAEAKTYGVPCILYDLPFLYFAEEGKGLIRVPQLDAERAAEAAAQLFRDPDRMDRLSAEALESSRIFSDDTLTGQWREIFSAAETAGSGDLAPLSHQALAWQTLLDHLHTGTQVWETRLRNQTPAPQSFPLLRKIKRKLVRQLHKYSGRQ